MGKIHSIGIINERCELSAELFENNSIKIAVGRCVNGFDYCSKDTFAQFCKDGYRMVTGEELVQSSK